MKRLFFFSIVLTLILTNIVSASAYEEYIVAQPGDQGIDAELVLQKCAEIGFIKELPENEDTYLDDYIPDIMNMEEKLGLTVDGIISLEEFEEIETAFALNSKGDAVRESLERLYDLGFIQDALPNSHDTLENHYMSAVKNAEKKYNLTIDGILTKSEQETLCKEDSMFIGDPPNVSARFNNDAVTVSWKAVKGAVKYEVYRDNEKILTSSETSWKDIRIQMGESHSYQILPVSYYHEGSLSKPAYAYFPVTGQAVSFSNTLTNGKPASKVEDFPHTTRNKSKNGNITVHSFTYQYLDNGNVRFTMSFTASPGYEISIFSPPNGDIFMLYRARVVTSSQKTLIQFEISKEKLNKAKDMSMKFFKDDKDCFWVFSLKNSY